MKNKSLGITSEEKYGSSTPCCSPDDKSKLYYPEVDLCPAQIAKIDGASELDTDDIVEMTVKARVSQTSSDENGKKVTMEITEIDNLSVESEDDSMEVEAEVTDMEKEQEAPKTDRFGRKLPSRLSPKDAGMKSRKSLDVIIRKAKNGE